MSDKKLGRPKKNEKTVTLTVSMDQTLFDQYTKIADMLDYDKSGLFRTIFRYWLVHLNKGE